MNKIQKIQDNIEKLTGSKTFCILPWIHLATRPNGDARLCCGANSSGVSTGDHIIGLVKKENGQPANFGKDSLEDVFNNNYMKSVRQIMLNNEIPSSCKKCFDEEVAGVVSKRIWETNNWIEEEKIAVKELIENTDDNGSIPEKIRYFDFRLGHTCNLKCVMCSPHDSSSWVSEHKVLYPQFQSPELKHQLEWKQEEFNNYWYERPEFWDQVFKQIPNIRQIYFAGGEPLMIKEHKIFLKEIIKQGYAKNISLRYNSNGVFLDDETIDLWTNFKLVKFSLSMDGIHDRLNYIRYPASHTEMEKILDKLDNTPDNIQPNIAAAVQILNIRHLPEFIKWKLSKNYKKINLSYAHGVQLGGGLINLHLVWIPSYFDIRVLPLEDKQKVTEAFGELKEWLYNNYTKDNNFWIDNPYGWKRYEALLEFMNSEDRSYLMKPLLEYVKLLDKRRNLNFTKVFPEFAHWFL